MNLNPLAPEHQARANTFYRAHHSSMRASAKVRVWVVETDEILAALCLQPVDSGYWLTSLLVAPAHRHKGLARQLLSAACTACQGEVWLFCEPHLVGFYEHQGFRQTTRLPPTLASRLARYQRKKNLVACHRPTPAEATSA